ncbi:MAG: hypothetical protein MUO26_06910 [Methanotrichaceae archaeon]|nr:hypothetical protein [Methanotrichaceae archaeon]
MTINIGKSLEELERIRINIPAILFSGLTKKEFIICCYLLYLAGDKDVLETSPYNLSDELGFSPSSIVNHLRTLNNRGYIGVLPSLIDICIDKYNYLTINVHNLR